MRSPVALLVTSLAATVMAATLLLPASHASKCSYNFTYRDAMQGTFSSPGYPANYPEHIMCFYRFEAANNGGVHIKFEVFHLEGYLEGYSDKDPNCVYDYIDVYAEDVHKYKVFLGRYCGNTLPAPITSPQSTLLIEFVSDYTKPSMGFYGTYTFLGDNWQPFEHNSALCGPGQREGSGGVIQSPNYPQPYPPRMHCSWLIRVRDHEQVLLMIDDLDIGTSSQCTSASSGALQIYYGYATNNTLPNDSICGQLHSLIASRKRESASPSSRVVIRFITGPDNRDNSRGFRLTWTAIHLPQEGPCPEFQCAGGFACGLEGLGGLCDQLPRYCIHNDQRCDGIANCGQHDDSDERRCPREVLIMTALIAVPSLGVLTLLVVVLYCVRVKRVKKSCSQNQPLTATVSKQGSSSQSFNSHRSYQQCVMHTSFVDGGATAGGGGEGVRGGGPGDSATLRSTSGGSQGRRCSGGGGGGVGGGDEAMLMMMTTTMDPGPFPPPPPPPGLVVGLGPSGVSPGRGLPYMEEVGPEIDEQQLQIPIPIPRPPDPHYRTHQKRASYTMMKQNYEDGNAAASDI